MRNPQGYATVIGDLQRGATTLVENGVRYTEAEIDTYTCAHCNRVVHVPVRADPADVGGLCKQCMNLICPRCTAKGVCVPWEKEMLRREAKAQFHRDFLSAQ